MSFAELFKQKGAAAPATDDDLGSQAQLAGVPPIMTVTLGGDKVEARAGFAPRMRTAARDSKTSRAGQGGGGGSGEFAQVKT